MIKRLFASVSIAFALLAAPAGATSYTLAAPLVSPVPNGYGIFPAGTSAALVIKAAPGVLTSVINTNTSAQTVTFTCYDNASAASGNVLYAVVLAASQAVQLNIPATNGITCSASAATLAGNAIDVVYN